MFLWLFTHIYLFFLAYPNNSTVSNISQKTNMCVIPFKDIHSLLKSNHAFIAYLKP